MSHPEIALRKGSIADAPLFALIGATTGLEAFAGLLSGEAIIANCLQNHVPEFYAALLAKPTTHAWLVDLPSGPDLSPVPVGYMILSAPDFPPEVLQPEDIELKRIYLLSRFHGGGTAQRMIDFALETARELGAKRVLLGVHRDNARALAFYRRNGFTPVGTRLFRLGNSVYDDPVLALTL